MLKSMYGFTKLNEMLVGMKKDGDGNYKPDRFQYAEMIDYLKMLNKKHSAIIKKLYGIELTA